MKIYYLIVFCRFLSRLQIRLRCIGTTKGLSCHHWCPLCVESDQDRFMSVRLVPSYFY